jgi:hypothetical protein
MKGKSGLIPVASFFPAYGRDEMKGGPPTGVALLVILAQYLASLSVEEMQSGAGWADDPLILVFGNIWIAIQLVLDVEAGRRAPENEMGHLSECDGTATPDHDLAQGSPGAPAPLRCPCAGADRPAHDSPRIPDSPAGFLESKREIRPPFRFNPVLP